jgi:TolB-like protein
MGRGMFFSLWFLVSLSAGEPVKLAVLDFTPPPGRPELVLVGKALAETVETSLGGIKGLSVVERTAIDRTTKAMVLSQSGLIDEFSAPQVGRSVGADFLVFGSIAVQDKDVTVTWKVVSVATSAIAGSGTAAGKTYRILGISERTARGVLSALPLSGLSAGPAKTDTGAVLTIEQFAGFGSALDKADFGDLRGARTIADSIAKESPAFSACSLFVAGLEKRIARFETIREQALDTLMSGSLTYPKYQQICLGMMTGMQYSILLDFCLSCRGRLPAAPEGSTMTTEELNDYYICLSANMLKKGKVLQREGARFLSAYPGSMYAGSIKTFMEQSDGRR